MSANLKVAQDKWEHAWRGFAPGIWRDRVNTRDFIQRNYTPYEGDGSFLKGPTPRTTKMWETLGPLFAKEREKGVLDVSQVPSSILAHAPGYIDKANELIVGLQTDAPLKRAIMPNGGWRVVAASLESYKYKPDEKIGEIFTKYRKTHNDGVFDAYTAQIRKARSSGIVTGLPDAYGRGRIVGDYRRVALYGVDFLIEDKKAEKSELDDRHSTEEVIRLREELAEQIRSLQELKEMGKNYGYDISGPATNAREAVQWTYFGWTLTLLNNTYTTIVPERHPGVAIEAAAPGAGDRSVTTLGETMRHDGREWEVVRVNLPIQGVQPGKYLLDPTTKEIAYLVDPGIGGRIREINGRPITKLDSPKATIMALVTDGILTRKLPWGLV
ncbi:MAG TPA: pyruvate formate lyase family protein, partial [Burkholderiales bacterium]|nr:pyruvate formate lyase family protein [Burkholderiales bacterium]